MFYYRLINEKMHKIYRDKVDKKEAGKREGQWEKKKPKQDHSLWTN